MQNKRVKEHIKSMACQDLTNRAVLQPQSTCRAFAREKHRMVRAIQVPAVVDGVLDQVKKNVQRLICIPPANIKRDRPRRYVTNREQAECNHCADGRGGCQGLGPSASHPNPPAPTGSPPTGMCGQFANFDLCRACPDVGEFQSLTGVMSSGA